MTLDLPTLTPLNGRRLYLPTDKTFFQSERQNLISQGENSNSQKSPITPMPLTAPSNSSRASMGPKIWHNKVHGKIGFAALARNIASKWKVLDAASCALFSERATVEKARYTKELEIWKQTQQEKKRSETAAQQQQQKGSTDSGQDRGRVPNKEPLQDENQERPFESKVGQGRECLTPQKKRKLLDYFCVRTVLPSISRLFPSFFR